MAAVPAPLRSLSRYALNQQALTDRYTRELARRYNRAIDQLVLAAVREGIRGDALFSFGQTARLNRQAELVLADYERSLGTLIQTGGRVAWSASEAKNEALFGKPIQSLLSARDAFENRRIWGKTTADRVKSRTAQFRAELELAIDQARAEAGARASATELARRVRVSLQQPDRLFAAVRARRGVEAIQQAPLAYNPGTGTYRSSYKNVARLLRTQMQQAYREADYARWQIEPQVVGIEVRRSATPSPCPVCSALVGKYPKGFRFLGFHPSCACVAVPILGVPVGNLPLNYTLWVERNRSRWETGAGQKPYFVELNPVSG